MAERPDTELIIERRERLFEKKHARVLKKVTARPRRHSNGMADEYQEIPNVNTRGELHGAEVVQAERAAAARPGATVQLERVIERIIAAGAANVQPPLPAAPSSIALNPVRQSQLLLCVYMCFWLKPPFISGLCCSGAVYTVYTVPPVYRVYTSYTTKRTATTAIAAENQ